MFACRAGRSYIIPYRAETRRSAGASDAPTNSNGGKQK